jgi:ABC-2 type transport system ATP-binding protein
MSYIPDNPDLYEFMSGIRYLNFVGDVYGVPVDVREKHIAEYAEDMGITNALAEKVASYSHGMKQKLAIVAALMHEPKLLIMDEPFVGLDPKAAFILKKFMRNFCDNGGAIFFSTHVLEVAEKLCDKIAIIKGGKLLADGDIATVRGNESLEEVFLELVDDIKVEEEHA